MAAFAYRPTRRIPIYFTLLCFSVSSIQIWNDPMNDSATFTNWSSSGSITPNIVSGDCPHEQCFEICNGFISRTLSTKGYSNIALTFDIAAASSTQCTLSYNIERSPRTIRWQEFYTLNTADIYTAYLSIERNFSTVTWDTDIVDIKIEAQSCCYVSDFILSGTPNRILTPYHVLDTEVNWNSANNACNQEYGTYLVTIPNREVNLMATKTCLDFCIAKQEDYCSCWIGLYRIGGNNVWQWVDNTSITTYGFNNDGSAISYTYPWHENDPDVNSNTDAVVRIGTIVSLNDDSYDDIWRWGDRSSSSQFYPLCDYQSTVEPTKDPTNDLSNDPTNDPSNEPTNDPSNGLTNDPSNDTTNNYLQIDSTDVMLSVNEREVEDGIESTVNDDSTVHKAVANQFWDNVWNHMVFRYVLLAIVSLPICISCWCFIQHFIVQKLQKKPSEDIVLMEPNIQQPPDKAVKIELESTLASKSNTTQKVCSKKESIDSYRDEGMQVLDVQVVYTKGKDIDDELHSNETKQGLIGGDEFVIKGDETQGKPRHNPTIYIQ